MAPINSNEYISLTTFPLHVMQGSHMMINTMRGKCSERNVFIAINGSHINFGFQRHKRESLQARDRNNVNTTRYGKFLRGT